MFSILVLLHNISYLIKWFFNPRHNFGVYLYFVILSTLFYFKANFYHQHILIQGITGPYEVEGLLASISWFAMASPPNMGFLLSEQSAVKE